MHGIYVLYINRFYKASLSGSEYDDQLILGLEIGQHLWVQINCLVQPSREVVPHEMPCPPPVMICLRKTRLGCIYVTCQFHRSSSPATFYLPPSHWLVAHALSSLKSGCPGISQVPAYVQY